LCLLAGPLAYADTRIEARLILAEKKPEASLPGNCKDLAKDLKKLGFNSATLLKTLSFAARDKSAHKIAIERDFTVEMVPRPSENDKIPITIVWQKKKKKNSLVARIKPGDDGRLMVGGGSYKDGSLFLVITAK